METAGRRTGLHLPLLAESRSIRTISRWLGWGASEANLGLAKLLSWVKVSSGMVRRRGQRKNQEESGHLPNPEPWQGRTMIPELEHQFRRRPLLGVVREGFTGEGNLMT